MSCNNSGAEARVPLRNARSNIVKVIGVGYPGRPGSHNKQQQQRIVQLVSTSSATEARKRCLAAGNEMPNLEPIWWSLPCRLAAFTA